MTVEPDQGQRLILDALFEGVYFVDRQRRITYWNNAAQEMTGFSAGEVVGKCCYDRVLQHVGDAGEDLCQGPCPLQGTMSDGTAREARVYLHHKDGHRMPIHLRCLPLRDAAGQVVGGVEIFRDASQHHVLSARVKELEQMAYFDALTRVHSRRYVDAYLRMRLEEFDRYRWGFGVVLFDIDDFKIVNDRYGHLVGDRVLKMVATTLASSARAFDIVGRWGGEEFMVVFVNVSREMLANIVERFRVLVSAAFLHEQDAIVSVTVSAGATLVREADTIEGIVGRADQALYQSKQSGRNRMTVA